MNLIQFKQVQGLSSALAQNTSYATAISGYLDGEIWTIMTGDSTFTGQKTFVGDVVFNSVVTGLSSGNFLGGLWVNTDKVLTQADTGTLFVTTVNSQNITGTKTFQGQGSSDNVIFKGGKVTIQKWGSVGETSPELGVSGSLFITGSDGAPFQITRNSPWLNASSDPANGDLYYSGTPTSVLPAKVGIGVIPSHMLDVDGVGNFKSVLADGISGHILSGKTGFLEELQVGAGLDNYWNSGSLVSPFISSTSGNFSSALTLGGQPIVTGSAGGSTAWSNGTGSDIYYNDGNVGIGTDTPGSPLAISKEHSDADSGGAYGGIDNLILLAATEKSGQDLKPGDGVGILFKVPKESETQSIGARIAAVREGGTETASSTELVFEVSQEDETLDEAIRIDRDGKVGIGTASPTARLHVTGGKIFAPSGDFTESLTISGQSVVTGSSSGSTAWSNGTGSDIYYNDGNVGIGTDTPMGKVDIHGTLSVNSSGVSPRGLWFGSGTQALGYLGPQNYAVNGLTTGDFGISSAKSDHVFTGSLAFGIGGTESMRITADGNVGIGTTNPSGKLHLYGDGPALQVEDDSGPVAKVYAGDTEVQFGSWSDHPVRFNVGGSEKMRILSSGHVGIGTTSPFCNLETKARAGEEEVKIGLASADGTQNAAIAHVDDGVNERLSFRVGGFTAAVDKLTILNDGNVGIGTDSPIGARLHIQTDGATDPLRLTQVTGVTGGDWRIGPGVGATPEGAFGFFDNNVYSGTPSNIPLATRVVIAQDGNVGIGTDDPTTKLDVDGTISTSDSFTSVVATGYNAHFSRSDKAPALMFHGINSADSLNWTMGISAVDGNNNKLSIKRVDDAHAFTAEPFTILSNDNVGIGTDDPQAKLHVTGGKILAPSGDFSESLTISGQSVMTGSSSSTSPGGSNTEVQFNDGGSFGGSSNLLWNTSVAAGRLEVGFGKIEALPAEDPTKFAVSGAVRILDSLDGGVGDDIFLHPDAGMTDNFAMRTGGSNYFSVGTSYGAQVSGNNLTQQVSAPSSASSAGSLGQTSYDGSYFYVCVSADTWKRAALNTW